MSRQASHENISVGRVLTPPMSLVVRRDEEIAKFKAVTHHAIKVIFEKELGEISSTWQMTDKVPNLDNEGMLLDLKTAEKFLEEFNAVSATQGKIISVE